MNIRQIFAIATLLSGAYATASEEAGVIANNSSGAGIPPLQAQAEIPLATTGQELGLTFAHEEWKAQWIWLSESTKNTWLSFRKEITLDTVPLKVPTKIAVDSKYWLWINGRLVVFEGGLNRGPAPEAGYYDTMDLAPYLKKGRNVIAILAWYWGNAGRNSVDSGKGGLLFQAELGESLLTSDKSWKAQKHPAYGETTIDPPAYLYGGYNIGFDARNDSGDWMKAEFDDSSWSGALEKGTPPCSPWNHLEKRPVPLWAVSELKEYENVKDIPASGASPSITAILPHAAMVHPYFEIDAPAGLTITIRTDRHRISGGPGDNNHYNGHSVEYITRQGRQTFECLNWLYGEKVIYQIPEAVKIISLKYRETGYNCDLSGTFTCDDAALNTLWKKAQRTLYICMRDNYMDCPDRERGQWIGDVSLQVIQTFYALERSSDRLTVKCVDDFIRWQKDNVLRGNVPGIHCGELPSQSLHAISENGILLPYYHYTGDSAPIRKGYGAIINYLKLWKIKENGLVEGRKGDWRWFDHLDHQDEEPMENCWYYAALVSARKMGGLIHQTEDKAWLDERIKGIEAAFNTAFWKPEGYCDKVVDERANALAVVFGLASKDKYPIIRKILVSQKHCTPYMEAYVLEALFMMGYTDDAYQRMKSRYDEMIQSPVSTLWEDFSGHGTFNHAWSGAPLSLLCRYGAGIVPTEPAWKTFAVFPRMGPLKQMALAIPSVKGEIKLELRDESAFTMKLNVPKETTAVIGIPNKEGAKVTKVIANGLLIWEDGISKSQAGGTLFLEESKGYLTFSVPPGDWSFVANR